MKRSEIKEAIYEFLQDEFGDEVPYISRSLPSQILDLLEQAGMSPPEYLPEAQYHDNGKQLEVKPVRKWEKE